MSSYTPDRWLLVKITGTDPHYRVFGSWFGGYLGSDSWRMNSGITSVKEEGDYYIFKGHSGSEYHCYKKAYGAHSYSYGVINGYAERSGGHLKVIEELPDDITNMDWIIG